MLGKRGHFSVESRTFAARHCGTSSWAFRCWSCPGPTRHSTCTAGFSCCRCGLFKRWKGLGRIPTSGLAKASGDSLLLVWLYSDLGDLMGSRTGCCRRVWDRFVGHPHSFEQPTLQTPAQSPMNQKDQHPRRCRSSYFQGI